MSGSPPVKICHACFAAVPSACRHCHNCGHEFDRIGAVRRKAERETSRAIIAAQDAAYYAVRNRQ